MSERTERDLLPQSLRCLDQLRGSRTADLQQVGELAVREIAFLAKTQNGAGTECSGFGDRPVQEIAQMLGLPYRLTGRQCLEASDRSVNCLTNFAEVGRSHVATVRENEKSPLDTV